MCKVISVSNQKDGVGKTVTCVNLGIGLARAGKKVLKIDADPQGSLSISLGFDEPDKFDGTLATVLMKIINDEEFAQNANIIHHNGGIDILPSNIELSGLEISLNGVISRETILRQYIDKPAKSGVDPDMDYNEDEDDYLSSIPTDEDDDMDIPEFDDDEVEEEDDEE